MTFLTVKTCRKSALFRVGYLLLAALSRRLLPGIRFLQHPLPPPSSPFLAVRLPWTGMGRMGLTTFRSIDAAVPLAASYPPTVQRTTKW